MRTVLVVDHDSPAVVRACKYMREAGLRVLPARSAADALDVCQQHRIDVVVVDDNGDGVGKALVAELKLLRPTQRVVLLVSGHAHVDGADKILHKPTAAEKIFGAVAQLLSSGGKSQSA